MSNAGTEKDGKQPQLAPSLADVSDDVLLAVGMGRACSNPLDPASLFFLGATCRSVWKLLRPAMVELRVLHEDICRLCSKCRTSISKLSAVSLSWRGRKLDDADAAIIAKLARSGALTRLGRLDLSLNRISAAGLRPLLDAFSIGALPQLEVLQLYDNCIGDNGLTEMSLAISRGSLANLKELVLAFNQIGDEGIQAFSASISGGGLAKLDWLSFAGNDIGNDAVSQLWPKSSNL